MKKLWLKKASAILVAIVTLGLYIPPTHIDANANKQVSENNNISEGSLKPVGEWRQEEESISCGPAAVRCQ